MKKLAIVLKKITLLFIMITIHYHANCQNQTDSLNGIEALSYFKSKSESLILTFAANIPDTSKIYKEYNFKINMTYNDLKARYDQYRGFMKDCILSNSSIKKLKICLKSKNLSLKTQLDSLQSIINEAYIQQYILSDPNQHKIVDTSINVAATPADFVTSLINALTDGAVKIWTQISSLKKAKKDAYSSEISSKSYDLSDYFDLLATRQKQK